MSKLLGEYLISAKKITEDQLLAVLERQVTEGGRLGTNLIEMGFLTEEELTHFLSDKFKIPIVAQAALTDIPPELIQTIPRYIAIKYETLPFGRDGNRLRVAMADPTLISELETFPELQTYDLEFHIASEIRIQYFLKKYYQADTKPRYVSLHQRETDKLRIQSPDGKNNKLLESDQVELYMQLAKKDLLLAQDRDQAIKVLMTYLTLFLERIYCFSFKQGKLTLLMSVPDESDKELIFNLADLPLFHEMIKSKTFYDGPMISSGMEKLIGPLNIQIPPEVVILPMWIKEHAVAVIYGDNFFSRQTISHVPVIKKLVKKTALALEILILRKKIDEG